MSEKITVNRETADAREVERINNLFASSVPASDVCVSPSGHVVFSGRRQTDIVPMAVLVSPEIVLEAAHAIAVNALAAANALAKH